MDKCVPVDWKLIVTEDVQSQHIRCHELKFDDNLVDLVYRFKKTYAKAVVLINTQENYNIAPQLLSRAKGIYTVLIKISMYAPMGTFHHTYTLI